MKRKGVEPMVRVSLNVPESMWRELRHAAEEQRAATGRASVAGLLRELAEQHLARRKEKGGK